MTHLWNNLPPALKEIPSLKLFKTALKPIKKKLNAFLTGGSRMSQIILSRMRQGCSPLRADLFYNIHVLPDPFCTCGTSEETVSHYLLKCPNHNAHRTIMLNTLIGIQDISAQTLTHGATNESKESNRRILEAVHSFIIHTSRFHPP